MHIILHYRGWQLRWSWWECIDNVSHRYLAYAASIPHFPWCAWGWSTHQAITGEEAMQRLKQHGGLCYLTQYSKSNNCYILSVYEDRAPPVIEHFQIFLIPNSCASWKERQESERHRQVQRQNQRQKQQEQEECERKLQEKKEEQKKGCII
jgi:hypothetical protein